MRDWIASLEEMLDRKFFKWKKTARIENGEAVQFTWQFNQTHAIVNVFWRDGEELVKFQLHSPRSTQRFEWAGLKQKTFERVEDRAGNLSQTVMYPLTEDHGTKP